MKSETEKEILKHIQQDIPLDKRPFKIIGDGAHTAETEVLAAIRGLMKKGIIRKFGAILRHQKAGFTHNAMVVWAVPSEKCESAGQVLASFKEVTHCYERTPPFEGKYTIFTMVHFHEGEQETIIQKLSHGVGIQDFKVLISEEEYKKSSMEYFSDVK
ncbi:MAG: Lrp/AsnC family transcriptional regulator [Syntrophaceae bacterium]